MIYNVDYEICTILFMVFFLVMIFTRKGIIDFQHRIFRVYVLVSFTNTCLDVITCKMLEDISRFPFWINYILNSAFLVLQCVIPTIFLMYVYFKVQRIEAKIGRYFYAVWIPAAIGVFLVITSYFSHYIFYIDETGYHHGSFHIYLYINVAFYALASILYTISYRKILKQRQCIITFVIIFCAMAPVIVQFFFQNYMLAGVGSALSVFVMYFTDENQEIYEDTVTNALNREAFIQHVYMNMDRKLPEQIFVIALDNFKLINEMHGVEGGNEIMQILVSSLADEYGENHVYRFGGDIFVVVLEEKTEGAKELDIIRRIVSRRMHLSDNTTAEMTACICLLHTIHIPQSNLVQTIEQAIFKVKRKGKGQFIEVDEDATEDMHRLIAVEQALLEKVESGRFEVHYQPIFDTHTKRFHSMEALARLNVYGYGYVSPEEFILIAEKNGTILKIGLLVLEEVCRFISENNLREKGIEFIEVNLSVVQCMQDSICQDIMNILNKYDVPPSMINLEITESAAADSEEKLVRNMARLALTDITFSLDDYGSGFSNINYIVDLPFSIVKLDKYIVWAAMRNVTSRRVIEHTVAMFKSINLNIVAEGVEDIEMVKILTDMGVDYLQGFYFSRPVPKEQLLLCLEQDYIDKKLNPKKNDKEEKVNV